MSSQRNNQSTEIAIIGGGAAGLSAALTLTRARRRVIVIDDDAPRNAPAVAAHGLIGQEGVNPQKLLAKGREEVSSYGAAILHASVTDIAGSADHGFVLTLTNETEVKAEQLVIATGVVDELPKIPGLAERWGMDVLHCPYCHGWEVRDQRVGVLATGPMSAKQALLFHHWSPHTWFLTNNIDFPAQELDQLTAVGITIIPGDVRNIEIANDRLTGVALTDGQYIGLDAVATHAATRPRLNGLENLGLEVAENATGVAVVADTSGQTTVPGVWAAGNVVNPTLQISEAAANGARVAMTINAVLIFAATDRALASAELPLTESQ